MSKFAKASSGYLFRIVLTMVVLASALIAVPSTASAISVASSTNPAWPNKCGLKIGLLIDRSDSISSSEGSQMKTAAVGFVDALAGTPSEFGVASFGNTATQNLGLTSVTAAAGATTVKNSINALSIGGTGLSTNWEAGFYSQSTVAADVVVILTDGNPTRRGIDGSGGNGFSDPSDFNIDAGITRANALKAQGKRIVAIGIGNDLDVNNLKAVSGPTLNDDYFTSSFSTLNAKLIEIANKICGGTVTVQKQVKNADGSYTPTNGWTYSATNAAVTPKTTAGNGTLEFKFDNAPKTTTITETLQPGYLVESVICSKNGQTIASSTTVSVALTVGVNDIISCVFKNRPNTATLTINKTATGGNASFPFTSTVAGKTNFNIVTAGGTGTTGSFVVPAGAPIDVTEVVPAGWSLSGLNCTGTSAVISGAKATFTPATDANIVCNYLNSRDTGTVTVVKNVTAAGGVTDGSFDFTSTIPSHSSFNLATTSGTKSTVFNSVPTGTYDIAEVVPAGWSLTGLNCTGGATPVVSNPKLTVTLAKNQSIVCTFTNARQTANLTVMKNVNAAGGVTDGSFDFLSNTPLGNFGLTTVGGTKSTGTVAIPTGTYDIAEFVPAGWSLANPSCTGASTVVASPKVTITATSGADIVCTFTNTRQTANLTIVKNVTAAGGVADGTFSFNTDTLYGNFIMTTTGGTAQTSTIAVPTGAYNISEVVPAGWSLANSTCSGTSVIVSGPSLTITVAQGENILCTFTNTRQTANLTIVKNVTAAGGVTDGSFDFTSDTSLGDFNLLTSGGTASTSTATIPTGNYSISEVVPAGWSLTGLSCSGTDESVDGSTVSIDALSGEEIVCTFTNERDTGTVTVVKNVISAGGITEGTFGFSSDTSLGSFSLTTDNGTASTSTVSVPTGSYEVAEVGSNGFSLESVDCTNADYLANGTKVSFGVSDGSDVVCTFTNTPDTAKLRIRKIAVGGNGTFNFSSDLPTSEFSLTTVGGTAQTEELIVPAGSYDISESVATGWKLTSLSCEGGESISEGNAVRIDASKDAEITCTFTNTKDPEVQGTVVTRPEIIDPPVQVKGVSTSRLAVTGSGSLAIMSIAIFMIGLGLIMRSARSKKGLLS